MNFAVVGAGAWGTAFAVHLARLGQATTLLPRRAEQAAALTAARENAEYLPGVPLPFELRIGSEWGPAVSAADVAFLACPAQALRLTMERIRQERSRSGGAPLFISLAKGLELGTHLRPTEVVAAIEPGADAGILTGPTHAADVAQGLPAAMVLASKAQGSLAEVQSAISSTTLRVYTSDDVAGAEFGGALKNIYAIAAGCADGLRLGDNAKAALLTRALAEMVRVGTALGARGETFYGLSGFGDLVATCHGGWSRNREFGQRVGEGARAGDLIANRRTVVEGYRTTEAFFGLCSQRRVDAPILREVHAVLFADKPPRDALLALMSRGLKEESRV
ncbi:MAG TPA: NAD(P)H-dependent glycerol-3-phosphate dehydrogenase [Opitutaceae bacterium]|jgi:glycerol-3-phosphate dehydrogenase (NAD(P)+)|nr:NAD(P)H-dependent glycerol-3-phosphate dehydrogenase [Opitutaceae bacterium]